MNVCRPTPSAPACLGISVALTSTVVLALTVIGSSPTLLDSVVPKPFRSTVAGLGADAPSLAGTVDVARPGGGSSSFGLVAVASAATPTGTWSPRRESDHRSSSDPARPVPGTDYALQTTTDGFIAHWPCEQVIPVRSYDAPPGSEADLTWAVETVARASGLHLQYSGPGGDGDREGDGAITVAYGDHPVFRDPDVAGVGGPTVREQGRITRGSVTLRPDQISPTAGDPWSRALTMHELMHAIGVGHTAEQRAEVMVPASGPVPRTELGSGDRVALGLVGCP